MARNYSSIAEPKTLASDVTIDATQITLNNVTGLPSPPYVLVLNPDTASEEAILVTLDQSDVTAPTLKVQRAIEDNATAKAHTSGQTVKHMIVGSDLQLAHDHIDDSSLVHGLTAGQGDVVGTAKTQTLTNKTLTTPRVNENVNLTATSTELNKLDGATVSTAEINYLSGVTSSVVSVDNTQTLTNKTINLANNTVTGTKAQFNTAISDADFATIAGTETLTNKTLTSPTINTPTFGSGGLSPVGSMTMFAGSSAPSGWLLCNGNAVSRTTYASLFSVIGITYGSGDGSTTFNVPDLLGRVPMGAGTGTGLTARTLGAEIGSESTTLTSSHIPQHSHTIDHGHADNISANQAGHTHTIGYQSDGTNDHDHALNSGTVTRVAGPSDGGASSTGTIPSGSTDPAITISGGVTDHTGSSGNYGTASPTAVTAVQPSTVVNFIIKH